MGNGGRVRRPVRRELARKLHYVNLPRWGREGNQSGSQFMTGIGGASSMGHTIACKHTGAPWHIEG